MAGAEGARDDNSAFGINIKSDAIAGNENLISRDSAHANQQKINGRGIVSKLTYYLTKRFYFW